jgi:hypothetical protein
MGGALWTIKQFRAVSELTDEAIRGPTTHTCATGGTTKGTKHGASKTFNPTTHAHLPRRLLLCRKSCLAFVLQSQRRSSSPADRHASRGSSTTWVCPSFAGRSGSSVRNTMVNKQRSIAGADFTEQRRLETRRWGAHLLPAISGRCRSASRRERPESHQWHNEAN